MLYVEGGPEARHGHGDMRGPGENFDQCTCCAGLGVVVDGVSEVRRACRDEIRKGAHFIKIMASGGVASPTDRIGNTQFSEEEIAAAVQEAQAAETYVAAHIYTARAANRALQHMHQVGPPSDTGLNTNEQQHVLDEISLIRGAKSNQIAGILGHRPYTEVIHRDNLVFL